jgi:Mg2+ and Co2+ transporter CorA
MSAIVEHPDVKRMLLTMKAMTSAARAICYLTAAALDRSRLASDEAERRRGNEVASLLTPVAKAFSTDIGIEMASIGVQVHGGMGFVEETGAAQHLRDARILAIYEGTNGIQAIDLVMRKLPLGGGAAVGAEIAAMRGVLRRLVARGTPAFGLTAPRLRDAVESLDRATSFLLGAVAQGDTETALAGATPYLRLFGLARGGAALADAALAASAAVEAGDNDPAQPGRIALCRFFAENLATAAAGLEKSVVTGRRLRRRSPARARELALYGPASRMILVHQFDQALGGPELPRRGRGTIGSDDPIPPGALWIDVVDATREEDLKVEKYVGISIPTREDVKDIEPSEILYDEDDARYMTARLLSRAEDDEPRLTAVTFILKAGSLITVRYEEPKAFGMFAQRAARGNGCGRTGEEVLAGLIEAIMDRAADVLQMIGERIDKLSRSVFEVKTDPGKRNAEYQETLRALGRWGDLISKQRESLVSIERMLLFLSASYRATRVPKELRDQVRTTMRDLQSLEEHATFQSSKVQFCSRRRSAWSISSRTTSSSCSRSWPWCSCRRR